MSMSHPLEPRHALYAGWVLGIARRNGIDAQPVLDDAGNYTDRIAFPVAGYAVNVVVVVPPPPAGWSLPAGSTP